LGASKPALSFSRSASELKREEVLAVRVPSGLSPCTTPSRFSANCILRNAIERKKVEYTAFFEEQSYLEDSVVRINK
jgi:hypothetical protein